mgnify:FL=1
MNLSKIYYPNLSRSKYFTFSKNYFISCTGKRALIFDKKLQLIKEVDKLNYVYNAIVSPDESKVLLISNSNCFYILSLENFIVTKYRVNGKYCYNLEGNGCWNLDGTGVCLCVTDPEEILSSFRMYELDNMNNYKDLIRDKYWLTSVLMIPNLKKYLITGVNRNNHKNYLIWYDGIMFKENCINNFDDVIQRVEYNSSKECCIVYGLEKTVFCSTEGEIIQNFKIDNNEKIMCNFSDVFFNIDESKQKIIKIISKCLGLENNYIDDCVNCMCFFKEKYVFVGTKKSILCIDNELKRIELKIDIPYGVEKITEYDEDKLIVSTWNGIKVFKINLE